MRCALDERRDLIEQRARNLAETAIQNRESWIQRLGEPSATHRAQWCRTVATIAAYRDLYAITGPLPLGREGSTDRQRLDRARAAAALSAASASPSRSSSPQMPMGAASLDRL